MGYKIIVCSQTQSVNDHITKSLESSFELTLLSEPSLVFEEKSLDDTIVILDLQSLEVDFLDYFFKDYPRSKVIVLTCAPSLIEGTKYLKRGVKAYAHCFLHEKVLVQALDVVASGNIWIYPELSEFIISQTFIESKNDTVVERFSLRDQEIINLVKRGLSNKKIAVALDLSEISIKKALSAIYKELGVHDRMEMVAFLR